MSEDQDLIRGSDKKKRCWWCGSDPEYLRYHDEEWGRPVADDQVLFEKICLEGFQAGLSWLTILRKRPAFREAFEEFDFHRVANFNEEKIEQLVGNAGIVRHRGKINSTINNASRAITLQKEFGTLAAYFWQFEPQSQPKITSKSEVVATIPESVALSKDLKKRGWSFVGPTTCYAFMQAMGLVNDHLAGCEFYDSVASLKSSFVVPQ
ncbi:DNA-3-methyladenine glycosylase I [Planctomycetales bacterium 10988]|nr:DNA-3-methyladenine glycosylase I [Planctomycetales bacterium 10988]